MHLRQLVRCASAVVVIVAFGAGAGAQAPLSMAAPPHCPYGYYDYPPYPCAPPGYYGPGYFYNGIFLGVGPWANWGYLHGWGRHRFTSAGGGRYVPGQHHEDFGARGTNKSPGSTTDRGVRPEEMHQGQPHSAATPRANSDIRGAAPPGGTPNNHNNTAPNSSSHQHDDHPQ